MKRSANKYRPDYAAAALAAFSAFLFALVLAAAPGLHAHVHEDAGDLHHECAITIVQAGTELSDSAPALVPPQPAMLFATIPSLKAVWVAAPFLSACLLEHAPPARS